jgi:hypothetical protein
MKKIVFIITAFFALQTQAQQWMEKYVSPVTGQYVQMVEGKNKEVFIGYREYQGGKITVKKFENGSWSNVGDTAFSFGNSSFFKLAVGSDSMPVVGYIDVSKNWNITVMKFNKTKWDTLGKRGFTDLGYGEFGMVTNGNKIFVASQVYDRIKVWTYESGTNTWALVGSNGIASSGFPGGVEMQSFGTKVYVAYRNSASFDKKTYVRGTDVSDAGPSSFWNNVGNGFDGQTMSNLGIKLGRVKGKLFVTGYNLTTGEHFTFVNNNVQWNHLLPSLDGEKYKIPHFVKSVSIDRNENDSLPYIAFITKNDSGRIYRLNNNYECDSMGFASTVFHDKKITENPGVLSTVNGDVYVMFQDASNSKLMVKELCQKPTIIKNGAALETNNAASYQWYKDGNEIGTGGTGKSYTPTSSGVYTVKTTKTIGSQSCVQTSAGYNFILSNNSDMLSNIGNMVKIYPNPVNQMLNIELSTAESISIYTLTGKLIGTSASNRNHQMDVSSLQSGVYLLKTQSTGTLFTKE